MLSFGLLNEFLGLEDMNAQSAVGIGLMWLGVAIRST